MSVVHNYYQLLFIKYLQISNPWVRSIHLQVPQSPLCKHQRYNKTEHIIKYKTGDKEENKRSRKFMSKNPGLKIPVSGL